MAKKKQIIISEEELTPTTLAMVQDKKKANIFGIIWIFIIFAIFVAGVIYLPDITAYINNYLNPETTEPSGGKSDTPKDNSDNTDNKVVEYTIASDLEITEEKFKISNISIENNNIKFKITNLTSEVLELKKEHFFINLYNENKKLLQRIYLQDVVSPNSETDGTYFLTDNGATILSLVNINESDYPVHIVEANEKGVATLTCIKENEKIEYVLENNKVNVTNLIYEVSVLDANFNSILSNYQIMQSTYNSIEGVSSKMSVNNNILTFETIINLKTVKNDALNLKVVYPNGTDAKVIYFENTASGYTCN